MGRKSLVDVRSETILDAFERCVVNYGIEGSSLERIAEEAGIKRSLIRHYIGNRDALVDALIERITQTYRQQVAADLRAAGDVTSLAALLDYLFAPQPLYNAHDKIVIDLLMTAHDRFPQAKQRLVAMFDEWIAALAAALRQHYPPTAGPESERVAYALLCLSMSDESLRWLGMGERYPNAARAGAEALIESLRG